MILACITVMIGYAALAELVSLGRSRFAHRRERARLDRLPVEPSKPSRRPVMSELWVERMHRAPTAPPRRAHVSRETSRAATRRFFATLDPVVRSAIVRPI